MRQTQELLIQHWGMDETAAEALTDVISPEENERIIEVGEGITVHDAFSRDVNRGTIASSYARRSKRKVLVEGPCSTDENTDYRELFDVIDYVSDEHPDATIGVRINGIKPRTIKGWRGLGYSLLPQERQRLHAVHLEALGRGLPIFSEVTAGHELGEFAPYLSSFWLGALGQASTALRADASLFNTIPFAVKNGHDGSTDMVRNAILAARANTAQNEGSGVNIGTIASGPMHRGIPTGVLPVGSGNNMAAIIARGYTLPKGTSPAEGKRLALEHIGDLCSLARELGSTVLIDKTHGAPTMIGLNRKDSGRLVEVNRTISEAMEAGEIKNSEYIGGEVAEVSTAIGRTDPNYIVSWKNRAQFSDMIGRVLVAA